MKRRSVIVVLVIAALIFQALAVAPLTMAASGSVHGAASSHCAQHSGGGGDECPCCPDGAAMVAGCLTLCAAAAGPLVMTVERAANPLAAVTVFTAPFASSQTYAPPDPPPIR